MRRPLLLLALLPLAWGPVARGTVAHAADPGAVTRTYGFSVLGTPKLPAGFPNFPYVNPDAPKGGDVALATLGSFDSFNPFIVRGTAAAGVNGVFDTLMRYSADEAGTAYCHLCATIELPADGTWVGFDLRPEAKFNDGTPVTSDDVAWTFNTLRDQGRPFYRTYYANVSDVTTDGPQRVVFHLKANDSREMPLILGELPVLPKHWWQGRDFTKPLTDPPLGSGPYKVGRFEFGRSVSYQLVPDYWGRNAPTGRGLNNFAMHYEYFRDSSVAMEAFKAGQIDFRQENISKNWATAYDFPAVRNGLVIKDAIRTHLPAGMQGFAMNIRRPVFADRRVREALAWAFDFQWMNKNLFYGLYTRTDSYFANSDYAATGLPTPEQLKILDPFRKDLPDDVYTKVFTLPVTDGSGNNRPELLHSLALLKDAGWEVKDRKLVDKSGHQMTFTILLEDPSFERTTLPYADTLSHLGINATVRTVDPSQYEQLVDAFDYDMTVAVFPESDVPGNEQANYWSCQAAKTQGSQNIIGICNPAIDSLVRQVVTSQGGPDFVPTVQSLDRALLWGWYVVPNWYSPDIRVAYWNRFGRPGVPIRTGLAFNTWWVDTKLAQATDAARAAGK